MTDLDPELPGDLGLNPLEQRLLGAQPPLVLRLAVDAAFSQAPAIVTLYIIIDYLSSIYYISSSSDYYY